MERGDHRESLEGPIKVKKLLVSEGGFYGVFDVPKDPLSSARITPLSNGRPVVREKVAINVLRDPFLDLVR